MDKGITKSFNVLAIDPGYIMEQCESRVIPRNTVVLCNLTSSFKRILNS